MAIVKSTAPAIKANSEKITSRMYERMFGKFPYAKPLFKNAPKNQPQVLARSIVGYAENIDNLAALDAVLERIAVHHVETSILPEHYPWVGESLLGAIKDILGDAITDEVNDAWTQAYWYLANVLIEKEKQLYKELLTDEKKKIVKDTAPFLKENGESITTRMYEIMFTNYPDAKKLFNKAPKDQNKVLARSIIGYAENIDNLSALTGAIERIAANHVSTNVKPIHYPWVVECLLQAISEVLGDKMTDEIKEAWFAAYWFLADILMTREKELYAQ
ncbi:globin domain-containing protein [Candidatus Marithioploca araucensis]|uniref:Globin domain-containing protein n=1 Tax=Candidatus Marithioploca araucensis TaxID=70273 RepID=A0ABT7VVI1_9GAMM|nr:globin domain-containing protein [Candidatus Marithioploca araucensis]